MNIVDMRDIDILEDYYKRKFDSNPIRTVCFLDCGKNCTCNIMNIKKDINSMEIIQEFEEGYYDEYGRWHRAHNSNLDRYTFGNSKAAVTLVNILNELDSEKITEKVSGFIVRYHQLIKHAQDIKDPTTRSIVGYMFIEKINNSTLEVPDKVKSFMKNVVIGKIKDKLINL